MAIRVHTQEGKNSVCGINWEIKCSWRSESCELLSGIIGGPTGKALEKFAIFSLKLVLYTLLKIIKLKLSVSIQKTTILILKYAQLYVFLVLLRSRKKQR